MLRILLLITALITLSSCVKRPLKARLEAITPGYRASSAVGSPDPLKCRFCGQQIVVSWKVSKQCQNLRLFLTYITGTHRQERVELPIEDYRGALSYRLVNRDYLLTKGILTYKVEIYSNDKLLYCFKPRSWVEWVDVES
jgi:hypothetical protein